MEAILLSKQFLIFMMDQTETRLITSACLILMMFINQFLL
ncbi:hypothetical protein LOCK900_2755 [Lacticaseibacillus rhamnosus LOCK900]|nr:hypothetical protein LOCK900_2755 [Lacticaseibacillus rhamnosus LOCK900]